MIYCESASYVLLTCLSASALGIGYWLSEIAFHVESTIIDEQSSETVTIQKPPVDLFFYKWFGLSA